MKIILIQDVDKLGDKYDLVDVKNGYGRNYLIPQGLGIVANATNMKKLDAYVAQEEEKLAQRIGEFKELAEKLKDSKLTIGAKVGESGNIFGSVNNSQISLALKDQMDVEIGRRHITIEEEIKTPGEYVAKIDVHPEVPMEVKFDVVAE